MRFPLALTAKIAGHIIKHKLRKTPKFAMVLQLEPLHTCNLTCTGCGRIRESDAAARSKVVIRPSQWMYWNVHVDGLEFTHDLIVEREGVFKECIEAIKMAKILGFQCATNTTVYKETDVQELEDMFKYLSSLEVDGHTISPGYEYDAAKKDMVKRL